MWSDEQVYNFEAYAGGEGWMDCESVENLSLDEVLVTFIGGGPDWDSRTKFTAVLPRVNNYQVGWGYWVKANVSAIRPKEE